MLELGLKNLVTLIKEITNSHHKRDGDQAMLSKDWIKIFEDFEGWVILSARSYSTNYIRCN